MQQLLFFQSFAFFKGQYQIFLFVQKYNKYNKTSLLFYYMHSLKVKTPARNPKNYPLAHDENDIPKKQWKQVLSTIKSITSQIQTLSLDKGKGKSKCFSKKSSLKTVKTTKNLKTQKRINTQETVECPHKSNPKTPCHYFKEYEKLRKRNEVLEIEKATLQKLILSNNKQDIKQKKNQSKIKKGKENYDSFFSTKSIKSNSHVWKSTKAKEFDKSSFQKFKNNDFKLVINKKNDTSFYSEVKTKKDVSTARGVEQSSSYGEKKKQQFIFNQAMEIHDDISSESNLKKLQNQFNRLLELNRVEKNKIRKKAIRKQMQQIAKRIKEQKQT